MENNSEFMLKIDKLTKVMAFNAVKDKDKGEQVMTLLRFGFSQAEVASIIGMQGSNLSRLLKKNSKGKKGVKNAKKE